MIIFFFSSKLKFLLCSMCFRNHTVPDEDGKIFINKRIYALILSVRFGNVCGVITRAIHVNETRKHFENWILTPQPMKNDGRSAECIHY